MWIRAIAPFLLIQLTASVCPAQEPAAPDLDAQIRQAVLAAPESMRADATVLGYGREARESDPLSVLRQGKNSLICLADDPEVDGFHVACYHRSLDDFMALGRRMRAEGKGRAEVMDARYAALEAGTLTMPERAALYSITADGDAGDLEGARRLVVVYVPGATLEDLGLPGRPAGNLPWLMLPGTPWAHIMIGLEE
ncbi:MAG: hypothetical protein Q8W46_09205 [Candidatus Palauibacterales bacterium]|nr:hypothetical protein [Candidatus Palauibacterales bacterium]